MLNYVYLETVITIIFWAQCLRNNLSYSEAHSNTSLLVLFMEIMLELVEISCRQEIGISIFCA